MPLYDYKCGKCGHIFGVEQRITEEPLRHCPKCKGEIKRLISAAGIIFKGSGFHVTDYGKKPCLPLGSNLGVRPADREAKETKKTETVKKSEPKEVTK